ncbi:hypothetical protein [Pontimicrobium aquaticum]|uniref:hypothetical protein n=1 Tax=Pontimicrobium aquaticum TaxID=2565367 RepID=UPI00145DADEC|nr:hypothetical protein [Pontimicrobium aquaticum]
MDEKVKESPINSNRSPIPNTLFIEVLSFNLAYNKTIKRRLDTNIRLIMVAKKNNSVIVLFQKSNPALKAVMGNKNQYTFLSFTSW